VSYKVKDHYFLKAKQENFKARSVYKLQEIHERWKLIKPGSHILDLGAAPGSWSQYAAKIVGPKGGIVAIDLSEMDLKEPNVHIVQGDAFEYPFAEKFKELGWPEKLDAVISDMAPKTTGIKSVDQARSAVLCDQALHLAKAWLRPGGYFVCKFFFSDDFKLLQTAMKASFQRVEVIKPDSTRRESKELFLIGIGFKG
jgi:23S rRNA (uridine2552-2'-O)-methyltransferase